jgi:integrase
VTLPQLSAVPDQAPRKIIEEVPQPREVSSRKVIDLSRAVGDSLDEWITSYLDLAVIGVRSAQVAGKITLHLTRFAEYFAAGYGHRRLTAVTMREVNGWLAHLSAAGNTGRDGTSAPMAAATVGNHLAHLSGFFTWVASHCPDLLPHGDPTKKTDPPPIPAPTPRALSAAKVRTLKNTVDRIESFHHLTGRRHRGAAPTLHRHARPLRDRAIVFVILGTGLRRAEITGLDLHQVEPRDPDKLRRARSAKLVGVHGKGRTTRTVFLGQDARTALADYLEHERPGDASDDSAALFLAAASIGARRPDGRLSPRTINNIVAEIGRIHDAQFDDSEADRRIGGLTPHDGRHTFAYRLSKQSGHNRAELERRLGHANERYLKLYTNPPDDEAAELVEEL